MHEVLISSPESLLALPYLTQDSDFDAQIFATESTLSSARHLLKELFEYDERLTSVQPRPSGMYWLRWEIPTVIHPF